MLERKREMREPKKIYVQSKCEKYEKSHGKQARHWVFAPMLVASISVKSVTDTSQYVMF